MRAPTAHALYACIGRFGGAVVRASAFTSEFVGSILATDSFEKSQRSAESRGFSLGALVSSHRES